MFNYQSQNRHKLLVLAFFCLALFSHCGSSSTVITGDARTPEAVYARGKRLADAGDHLQAKAAFEEALTLNPDYAPAYEGLSWIAIAQDKTTEATKFIRMAKIKDARYVPTWIVTGVLYNSVKRHKDALNEFEEALRLDPDKLWAVSTYFYMGQTYEKLNMHEQAYDAYVSSLNLDALHLEARDALERVEKILGPEVLNNPWRKRTIK